MLTGCEILSISYWFLSSPGSNIHNFHASFQACKLWNEYREIRHDNSLFTPNRLMTYLYPKSIPPTQLRTEVCPQFGHECL